MAGEAFAVRVTDNEGDVSTETTLDITVNDDGPTANNDLATQATENQAITIDVFANDVAGADGVDLTSGVAVATGPSQGTLVYNNNGSFTYTPNANAEGADSFSYTITDGDGDTSTATVSITLAADSVPSVTVSDGTVDEKGLVDGSGEVADPAPNSDTSETTTGTFTIATGNDTLGSTRGPEQPRQLDRRDRRRHCAGHHWRADRDQHGRRLYLELHAFRQPAHATPTPTA